jgi:hypothetical protein
MLDIGNGGDEERDMPNAVIDDLEGFKLFLSAQPLCQWVAQKQREIDAGMHDPHGAARGGAQAKKDDNAELMAALSSMA